MPDVVQKISFSLILKPGQHKTIEGIKIRNVSKRLKQVDVTMTNLEQDKRVGAKNEE